MAKTPVSRNPVLTQSQLKELLVYDPETGAFTWRTRPRSRFKTNNAHRTWNSRYAGKKAGVRTHGYIRISIDDKKHYAHRLAWLYMTGEWPENLIDHRDEDGTNNSWLNLREATKATNGANRREPLVNNSTGFRGVVPHQGRFVAQCHYGKEGHYLGIFDTAEEAHEAYKRELYRRAGEFSPFGPC